MYGVHVQPTTTGFDAAKWFEDAKDQFDDTLKKITTDSKEVEVRVVQVEPVY